MLAQNRLRDTLAALETPVLSLYLHVDNARPENQADRPAWRIEQKNHLNELSQHPTAIDNPQLWEQMQQQLTDFFNGYLPNGRSLVVFTDGQQLEQYELPIALASQAALGQPLVMPLLWALDEYERYLILQVDSQQARFISAYLGEASEAGEMKLELDAYDFREKHIMPANNSTKASGGNDRDSYDSTIEAHVHRFYKQVIDNLQSHIDDMETRRLILSGDEQAAHKLQDMLPASLQKLVVGIAPTPLSHTETQVLDTVLGTALAYERAHENDLVSEIINQAKAGGRGALGPNSVTEALTQQRVEMLVLPYPPRETQLADELKQQAFQHGTAIELVHGEPAEKLNAEGGVGARLYYAL